MRVQTEEWRRFIPGSRMYKGKKTLFYNGEDLWEYLVYDQEEQQSWEVIIVLPGVEVIPEENFNSCWKVEAVIMADTVRRIEDGAFSNCIILSYVRLSRNLEYIGEYAFYLCIALQSIFLPASCREIIRSAFCGCKELIIFNVPRHTQLGDNVIARTALIGVSPFETNENGEYDDTEEVNQWIKEINRGEDCELHRACFSFNPVKEIMYGIVKRKGLCSFKKKNEIGLTAFNYLDANPFIENEIDQKALMKEYVMEMMGETVFNVI